MKTYKQIKEMREDLVRINRDAPYDKDMHEAFVQQINILDWVLEDL